MCGMVMASCVVSHVHSHHSCHLSSSLDPLDPHRRTQYVRHSSPLAKHLWWRGCSMLYHVAPTPLIAVSLVG